MSNFAVTNGDTIVAQATPPGLGGVGIVRISGGLVTSIMEHMVQRKLMPREAIFCGFWDGDRQLIDQGIAIYFNAPHSFTGEEMLELQSHGNQVVIHMLIERALVLGARLANPGEFSLRAFLNHKIDLVKAEAVADIISATNIQAVKNAARSLRGDFSLRMDDLVQKLIALRTRWEGMIDFSEEEDVSAMDQREMQEALEELLGDVELLCGQVKNGMLAQNGIKITIAGGTNVGKSTLFNRLSGQDLAIVTHIPGTTRDVLRETVFLYGATVNLCDTAGFRISSNVADQVEEEGIRRAKREIEEADHVLFVVDSLDDSWQKIATDLLIDFSKTTLVCNKIDLLGEGQKPVFLEGIVTVPLSAKNGQGLELLREHLKNLVSQRNFVDGFSARGRHLDSLRRVEVVLREVATLSSLGNMELGADGLMRAQQILAEITGKVTSADILQRIFSDFCVGK